MALAVVFVVITAGIAIIKLINGSIGIPRLMPKLVDQASFWRLFTVVPVLVTAYICHHNGKFWSLIYLITMVFYLILLLHKELACVFYLGVLQEKSISLLPISSN